MDRSLVTVLLGTFTLRLTTGLTGALLVYYLADLPNHGGLPVEATVVGVFAATFYAVELILSTPFGMLSDRFVHHRVMQAGPIFGAVAVVMTWATTDIFALGLTRWLEGASTAASIPSILGFIAMVTASDELLRGRASARLEGATLAGLGAGMVLAGPLWEVLGREAFLLVFERVIGAARALTLALQNAEEPAAEEPAAEEPMSKYKEAPMLAEMVAAGSLPPLDERLPEIPLTLNPVNTIGNYGGRFKMAHWWHAGGAAAGMYGQSPLRWVDDGLGVAPGMCESWEANEDNTVWTFNFRKGLKWSDGSACTTADVLYWWNDMVLDPDLPALPPSEFSAVEGVLPEFTAVDDYTLTISYVKPAPLTAKRLAMWVNGTIGPRMIAPAEYAKKFNPKYNSEYKDYEEHDRKINSQNNPECPTLNSWMLVAYEQGVSSTDDRNPYYYCVDTVGNQLPYIDGIDDNPSPDAQYLLLQIWSDLRQPSRCVRHAQGLSADRRFDCADRDPGRRGGRRGRDAGVDAGVHVDDDHPAHHTRFGRRSRADARGGNESAVPRGGVGWNNRL